MERQTKLALAISIVVVVIAGGIFIYRNFRGIGLALKAPSQSIAGIFSNRNSKSPNKSKATKPAVNATDFPLQLPDGFQIDLVASDLPNARVLRFDQAENLWVSQPQLGTVARLNMADGSVKSRQAMFTGLDGPHGIVFDPEDPDIIYIGEESKVTRRRVSHPSERTTLMTLPSGGGHSTRTLGVGPDQRLYVTIGSSCNVCREGNAKRASMWVMDRDGKNQKVYATGLRNTVFFTWQGQELWGTDMGRDLLGDDIPPDEVNVIKPGKDYGWPFCYGQKVHDTKFDASAAAKERCQKSEASRIDLPAHSAPLGLAFIDDPAWPADWQGDLLIAYHGSWNRSVPTGYKIVRHKLSGTGQPQGVEDFITGWLQQGSALGRPVDLIMHAGSLFVSDDKAGVIYRIQPQSV